MENCFSFICRAFQCCEFGLQAIVKVLNENFQFDGEMKSQAHLFKNLWLEAEAKLCSVSYKARFDHMKIAMELQNSTRANGKGSSLVHIKFVYLTDRCLCLLCFRKCSCSRKEFKVQACTSCT